MITTRKNSPSALSPMEIVKYERSPQSQRRQYLERSLSWSQPSTIRFIRHNCNSMLDERKC
jgi:hypothetical protein